ncbi:MAG: hypothetical protein P4L36_10335 [Holophaga sp.]|nr:hypothetical protein [Holophaga sp.]
MNRPRETAISTGLRLNNQRYLGSIVPVGWDHDRSTVRYQLVQSLKTNTLVGFGSPRSRMVPKMGRLGGGHLMQTLHWHLPLGDFMLSYANKVHREETDGPARDLSDLAGLYEEISSNS